MKLYKKKEILQLIKSGYINIGDKLNRVWGSGHITKGHCIINNGWSWQSDEYYELEGGVTKNGCYSLGSYLYEIDIVKYRKRKLKKL